MFQNFVHSFQNRFAKIRDHEKKKTEKVIKS